MHMKNIRNELSLHTDPLTSSTNKQGTSLRFLTSIISARIHIFLRSHTSFQNYPLLYNQLFTVHKVSSSHFARFEKKLHQLVIDYAVASEDAQYSLHIIQWILQDVLYLLPYKRFGDNTFYHYLSCNRLSPDG